MEKLYIVMPAYNEAENIEQVVKEWYRVVEAVSPEGKLVIADDGSKDSTFQILSKLSESHPNLISLSKLNEGHGATLLYLYQYALDNTADYIFQTDSDGQTLPSEFLAFWKLRNEYDIIIGYRNKRKDGISRIFVTKTLKLGYYSGTDY